MKKLLKYVVCLSILVMVVALFTGCCFTWPGKVTGGGWFIDRKTDNKCTFGFNAQLKDNPGAVENEKQYTGQFQFNDHAGTSFHMDEITAIKVCINGEIEFKGFADDEYAKVTVEDEGEPGIGDEIEVRYDGKTWKGVLGGGNIQAHYDD